MDIACPLGHRHLERWTPALQEQCPIMFDRFNRCQTCGVIVSTVTRGVRNHTTCRNGYTVCGRCFYNANCPAREDNDEREGKCLVPLDDDNPYRYRRCPITIQTLEDRRPRVNGCGICELNDPRTCACGWSVCGYCYPSKCVYLNDPQPENLEAIEGKVIWV